MSGDPGILLACDTLPENPWSRDRLPAIRAALAGRRHEIIDIYDFGSVEDAHRIHRARARDCFADEELPRLNRSFRDRVLASNCRIVLLGTVDNFQNYLLPATIRDLRAAGCIVVGILGDDEFNFDRNWPYVFLFDRVVAYVKDVVDRYDALRPGACHYLPNSCWFPEPDFAVLQVPEEEKRHDVALFGSVFPARRRLVEQLVASQVSLSLFGGRGWLESPVLRPYYRGFVASETFDRTVRESRLVLALLEDHLTGSCHMNTKIWEAVRNGQMCIATRYGPLVRDYGLVENEDIVLYDSAQDLSSKIRHYLAHPGERRQIAQRLFEKVKARFNYFDLYRGLFDELVKTVCDRPPVVVPPAVPPSITLLGAPDPAHRSAGFPLWEFERSLGWRRRVKAEFHSRVRTSHVILASGSHTYDACLQTWLALGPNPSIPVQRLRSAGPLALGCDTLLWESATFEVIVLRGSWCGRLRAMMAPVGFPAVHAVINSGRSSRWRRWIGDAAIRLFRSLGLLRKRLARWGIANGGLWMVG